MVRYGCRHSREALSRQRWRTARQKKLGISSSTTPGMGFCPLPAFARRAHVFSLARGRMRRGLPSSVRFARHFAVARVGEVLMVRRSARSGRDEENATKRSALSPSAARQIGKTFSAQRAPLDAHGSLENRPHKGDLCNWKYVLVSRTSSNIVERGPRATLQPSGSRRARRVCTHNLALRCKC